MKKSLIIAAFAAFTLGAQAQEKLYLSTYNGTNLAKYDGKVCDVTVNRYVFNGWNTIALPFSMSEAELNDTFGPDCRLERLSGVEDNSLGVTLNFVDCKDGGIIANTPYMLYYTGKEATLRITKQAEVTDGRAALTYTTQSGETVTMEAARQQTEGNGLYGVLARDNSEVRFVSVGEEKTTGFYATRCYVRLSSGTTKKLTAQHLTKGETTSINAIAKTGEKVDVYTLGGNKVATKISPEEVNNLRPAVYIIKGQKVVVK
jgi:hypothetical protein